ncbi:hypothetical protein BJ165DRAFT_1482778, partial [Panaeolus papilionaceus]
MISNNFMYHINCILICLNGVGRFPFLVILFARLLHRCIGWVLGFEVCRFLCLRQILYMALCRVKFFLSTKRERY